MSERATARSSPPTRARRRAPARSAEQTALLSQIEQIAQGLAATFAPFCEVVVHDLLDNEVPWDEGERFARHLTAARLLTTLDLGHYGVLTDATVLYDCLRFLEGEAIGDKVVSSSNLPYGFA